MRAGVYNGVRNITVETVPDPLPDPDAVVLAVSACGICGTDLHSYATGVFASPGQIMGHEFSGVAIDVGANVKGVAPGDRLTAMPMLACGACPRCREGRPHLCRPSFTTSIAYGLPGAFAEFVRVPAAVPGETIFALPKEIATHDAALIEPLAVAVHAARFAPTGDVAVVLGLGPIGLLLLQVLLAYGYGTVLAVERSPLRQRTAAQLGATLVPDSDDLGAALDQTLDGTELDAVFEFSSVPELLGAALDRVRPGGRVVIPALYEEAAYVDLQAIAINELTLHGSLCYSRDDFREAIALMAGAVRTDSIITHRVALEELQDGFEQQMRKGDAIKVLVEP